MMIHDGRYDDRNGILITNRYAIKVKRLSAGHYFENPACRYCVTWTNYALVIQHSNGKSPMNGGFSRKIANKWSIFYCHV